MTLNPSWSFVEAGRSLGLPTFQAFNSKSIEDEPLVGFYFCSGDSMILRNLMFSSFEDAELSCDSIWTLHQQDLGGGTSQFVTYHKKFDSKTGIPT